jgi:serine/threonine protein kinase
VVGVELARGCQLAGYQVEEILAEGRLGTVYRGSGLCRKPVAIKVLRREVVNDPLVLGAFVKEVYGVNRIGHPGIVDVCSVGLLDDGRCFVVMDWVDGVNLSLLLTGERKTVLEPSVALALLEQLCQIVGSAHDAGHLHLGLDPRRLLLLRCPPYPTIRVLGFGSACLTDSSTVDAREVYIAPEQQAGRAADRRSDIFSIGMLFYEMVTGRHPLDQDDSCLKRLAAVGNGLTKVILRALARDPSARYGSTAHLLAAAKEVLEASTQAANLEGDVETQVSGPPQFTREGLTPVSITRDSDDDVSTHVSPPFRDTKQKDDEEPTATEPALFPPAHTARPRPLKGPTETDPFAPGTLLEPPSSTGSQVDGLDADTEVGQGRLEFAAGSSSGLFSSNMSPLPRVANPDSVELEPDEETRRYKQGDTIEVPPRDDPDDETREYDEQDTTRPYGLEEEEPLVFKKPKEAQPVAPLRSRKTPGRMPAGPLDDTFVEGTDEPGTDGDAH